MKKTILIFPATMTESVRAAKQYKLLGYRVIGASTSNSLSLEIEQFDLHRRLPYVTDPGFESKLKNLLAFERIELIHCPHPTAHVLIRKIITGTNVSLLNPSTTDKQMLDVTHYAQILSNFRPDFFAGQIFGPQSNQPIGDIDAIAMLRHWDAIEGHCSLDKVIAWLAIAPSLPRGDIIEIGCLSGKSAFVLLYLAKLFDVGRLLCIDPWSNSEAIQRDSPALLNKMSLTFNFEEIFKQFCINLRPYALDGELNYIRTTSELGLSQYANDQKVHSPEFGETVYAGQAAMIHIDGNHDYRSVSTDIHSAAPLVAAGGWLVIDDYYWKMGDGPQMAGDLFLQRHLEHIDKAFVAGEALFIQFRTPRRL